MTKKIADKGSSELFLREHVSSTSNECIPWPYGTSGQGYGLAVIGGKQRPASHWMCVLAHGDPIPPRVQAAHRCGNPICVNPNHLRWATHAENMQDKKIHGTENQGERNGKTRLTADQVREIRSSPPDLKPLMEKFGMSKHGISKIRSGKRWSHIA